MKKKPVQSATVHRYNPKIFKTEPATEHLKNAIANDLGKQIPVSLITGLSKAHGRHIPVDSKLLKRITDSRGLVTTKKLQELLGSNETYIKGTPLSDQSVKRIHDGWSDQGRLSFEFLIKMSQELGVPISPHVAKGIVRKFGHRKGYLSAQDCIQVTARHRISHQKSRGHVEPVQSKTPKKFGK